MPSIVRHTPTADELSDLADRLIAEARIALRIPFKGQRSRRAAAANVSNTTSRIGPDPVALAFCMGDVLGLKFMHDPFKLADELGIRVLPRVAAEDMTTDPEVVILGRAVAVGDGFIQLADGLGPYQEAAVLAHEVGHILGFANEDHASIFASAYVELHDEEKFKYFANRLARASMKGGRND